MFTWWGLYRSVPYESVAELLKLEAKTESTEVLVCADAGEKQAEEAVLSDRLKTQRNADTTPTTQRS